MKWLRFIILLALGYGVMWLGIWFARYCVPRSVEIPVEHVGGIR